MKDSISTPGMGAMAGGARVASGNGPSNMNKGKKRKPITTKKKSQSKKPRRK